MKKQFHKIFIGEEYPKENFIEGLFVSCFHYYISNLDEKKLSKDKIYPYEQFKDICIKANIKEYAPYLYVYCRIFESISNHAMPIDEISEEEKQLTDFLIPFFSKDESSIRVFVDSNTSNKVQINDNSLVSYIKDCLLKRYKELGYNMEVNIEDTSKDIVDFYTVNENLPREVSNYIWIDDEKRLARLARNHKTEYDITLDFLTNKSKRIKSLSGTKTVNDRLSQLAEKISYIIRFQDFIEQKTEIDIEKYKLQTSDCENIYEILDFFKLIHSNISTSKGKYVRQVLINQYRDGRKNKYPLDLSKETEFKLNNIRYFLHNNRVFHITLFRKYIKEIDYSTFKIEETEDSK